MDDGVAVYSARGNVYAIVRPELARQLCGLPGSAADAAASLQKNGATLVQAVLACLSAKPAPADKHGVPIDGIVLGPFQPEPPFEAIIINTDGSLAERSGNGLTNFSKFLLDAGLVDRWASFPITVFAGDGRRTVTSCQAAEMNKMPGFWLGMGQVQFGPAAVQARTGRIVDRGDGSYEVEALRRLAPEWFRSVLVNVGNPHCVTFLDRSVKLPMNRQLQSQRLFEHLKAIAFRPAGPAATAAATFQEGANLQWAQVNYAGTAIWGRVFERGEGPTASSGTSATAIAAASRFLGLTTADRLRVMMPGGIAHIELQGGPSDMTARFFGVSERHEPDFPIQEMDNL